MTIASPPLRYLCLNTKSWLESDIDTWWSRMVGDRPIWGPEFEGWDPDLDTDENLRRRFGDLCQFDAVFLSHAFSTDWSPPTSASLGDIPSVSFQHEVRAVEHYDLSTRAASCFLHAIDIVLHPYSEAELDIFQAERELERLQDRHGRRAHQVFHQVPHHVRTDLFYPPAGGDAARDIDIVLVGRAHAPLYPLRARWARLIGENRWANAVQVPTVYGDRSSWTEAERRAEVERYAGYLRRTKIVVVCSSHWRYMLAKFNEIAACGAFLVSDVPNLAPQAFIDNMGIVSATMRDTELVDVVNAWLDAREERERRAARLSAWVTENRNIQKFWERADDEVREWRELWMRRPRKAKLEVPQ